MNIKDSIKILLEVKEHNDNVREFVLQKFHEKFPWSPDSNLCRVMEDYEILNEKEIHVRIRVMNINSDHEFREDFTITVE